MGQDNFENGEISAEFTLESILAEYKGMSYIEGDKKTPKNVLDEKARRIVLEETGAAPPDDRDDFDVSAVIELISEELESGNIKLPDEPEADGEAGEYAEEYGDEYDDGDVPATQAWMPKGSVNDGEISEFAPVTDSGEIETIGAEDSELDFFDSYTYSSDNVEDDIIRSVSEAIERENEVNETPRRRLFRNDRPFQRRGSVETYQDDDETEPDYREQARAYATRCNALSTRAMLSLILSVVLVVFTLIFEKGGSLPLGIGRSPAAASGCLLIIQIFVMMLGVDILIRGIFNLLEGDASAETLVFISCAASVLAGLYEMRTGGSLLPYSAISALSLTFALWGERMHMQALTDTLRSAATVPEPYSMISEYRFDMGRTVVRKTMGRHRGFYGNLGQADISELAYKYASPLLILFCVLITFYSAAVNKQFSHVPAMLSATCAAAATFTAALAFAAPFRTAARQERARGGAIAGAGGIDDIFYMDGFCVSDDDLYPPESLDVGSVRILDQVPPEKAIRYTASMIVASGSCLARVFTSILINKGMSLITTQNFTAGEGGVSGIIRGEQVHTGNFAYMNLYGVRVPDELKMGGAIYTAVDGRMIAMFSVDYKPSMNVRNAVMAVLRHGIMLYLTVRDFNITPMTIEQKFKIPMEDFELLPIRSTYDLSEDEGGRGGRTAAVYQHGAISDMSRIIATARRVKLVSLISTIISVASAVLGVILMAILCWSGATGAAQPGNLLLFMAAPIVILLITEILTVVWNKRRM